MCQPAEVAVLFKPVIFQENSFINPHAIQLFVFVLRWRSYHISFQLTLTIVTSVTLFPVCFSLYPSISFITMLGMHLFLAHWPVSAPTSCFLSKMVSVPSVMVSTAHELNNSDCGHQHWCSSLLGKCMVLI